MSEEFNKYRPPNVITPAILNLVAGISEEVGRLTILANQVKALRLRCINRIKTIHGSLAIEGNTGPSSAGPLVAPATFNLSADSPASVR